LYSNLKLLRQLFPENAYFGTAKKRPLKAKNPHFRACGKDVNKFLPVMLSFLRTEWI
jgi:hypothetical protein